MFITFEAGEGAGKTTQVARLVAALAAKGLDVVRTREPGGSEGAEIIRDLVVKGEPGRWSAETEILLFTAARRDHLERTVLPVLERGGIVVCDRFLGSTLALQGAGGGFDAAKILRLHADFCFDIRPDLTIFIDVPDDVSLGRSLDRLAASGSAESRMEMKGRDFHLRVNACFRGLAATDPAWVAVDGTGSIEEVGERILAVVLDAIAARTARAS